MTKISLPEFDPAQATYLLDLYDRTCRLSVPKSLLEDNEEIDEQGI